jgi:predicted RNase H-like HicB family nuclease
MTLDKRLTMVYWEGEHFWLGKLLEHPEIMTQGETQQELEENLRDAYRLIIMDDYGVKSRLDLLITQPFVSNTSWQPPGCDQSFPGLEHSTDQLC